MRLIFHIWQDHGPVSRPKKNPAKKQVRRAFKLSHSGQRFRGSSPRLTKAAITWIFQVVAAIVDAGCRLRTQRVTAPKIMYLG